MTEILLAVSVAVNLALVAWVLFRKVRPPRRPQSEELREFLADLTGGKIGYVAVTRLNPDDFLLRSPKR
jgi:hypothetical protein